MSPSASWASLSAPASGGPPGSTSRERNRGAGRHLLTFCGRQGGHCLRRVGKWSTKGLDVPLPHLANRSESPLHNSSNEPGLDNQITR